MTQRHNNNNGSDEHDAQQDSGATPSDQSRSTPGTTPGEATPGTTPGKGEIQAGSLAGKSMWAAIWILALPVLLQYAMQACVGLVDTVIAGRLPDSVAAVDGIGVGSYMTWFIMIAMTGLGIGGQAMIARAMGAGDKPDAHRALGHAVALSVIWGVIVGAAMWFFVQPLGALARLTPETTDVLSQYVRVISLSLPAAGLMMVGAMCLYGAGDTTRPAVIAIAVNLINMVVSWALAGVDIDFGSRTLVNPFSFDLGVVGIAAGTGISYLAGALMTLWVLVRGVKDLRLQRRDIRIERRTTRRLIRVGLPGFFDSLMMWMSNLFVLFVIGLIAAKAALDGGPPKEGLQGAHFIAIRWEALSFLPGFALGTAAGALAGQYLGAGNPRMARRAIVTCTAIGSVLMGLIGLVFIFGGEFLTRIISDEPAYLEEVPPILFIAGLVQVFFGITMVIRQGLRGVGDTRWTFILTSVSSYGIRLPAAWLFGVVFELGLTGVWIGLSGELVIRAALFTARFIHGGWARVEV